MKNKYLINYLDDLIRKNQIIKAKSKEEALKKFNHNNDTSKIIVMSIKKVPIIDLLVNIINIILIFIIFSLISYAIYDENNSEIDNTTEIDNLGEPVKLSNKGFETGDVRTLNYNIPQN